MYKNLTTICAAAVLALGLAACGGGGGGSSGSGTPGTSNPGTTDPMPATGMVADVIQTTGLMAAVATSDDAGNMITVAAGESASRGGVMFDCPAGDVDCVLTFSVNADGDVEVAWSGAAPTATFIDPLENMNEANEAKIAAIMGQGIGTTADTTATPPRPVNGADDDAVLGGLKSGGTIGMSMPDNAGADNFDSVTLASGVEDPDNAGTFFRSFDPNVQSSTLRAMADDSIPPNPSNDIGMEQAGALGLEGWSHKVLHADWGDTAGGLDAGIETAALIYTNLEMPTAVDFGDLASTLVDTTLQGWFALTVNFGTGVAQDADDATDDPNNAVVITDAGADTAATQVMNALVSPTGQAFDARIAHPDNNDEIRGEYFGASGTFKCTNTTCQISRNAGGSTPFALSGGGWLFTPDDGETVTIPDQDWVAFGVWLTAPDNNVDGVHDIGVFYDGMEMYDETTNAPNGTATFAGKAAGYYVNGESHGLFTADASLTATFADAGDTLSGSIQNFLDSAGRYIDTDNPSTPNDPNQGGENDWGVTLVSNTLNATGNAAGTTSGTADGVTWNGNWNAQLYGPGSRNATDATAPSGVAGNFRAITGELTGGGYKGVVGAFGAEQDSWTAD